MLRRNDEVERGGYVDRVSSTVGMAVLALLVLSAVDAALTLKHIELGGVELMPTMSWAILVGPEFFVGLKMFLTAMGGILLAALEYYPAARRFLPSLLGVYILLMAYHCLLVLTEW